MTGNAGSASGARAGRAQPVTQWAAPNPKGVTPAPASYIGRDSGCLLVYE